MERATAQRHPRLRSRLAVWAATRDDSSKSHELRHDLYSIFGSRVFFETLRLEPYYEFSAERVPEAKPFLFALIEENRGQCVTLVYGDSPHVPVGRSGLEGPQAVRRIRAIRKASRERDGSLRTDWPMWHNKR
jgi:hypothetical protein